MEFVAIVAVLAFIQYILFGAWSARHAAGSA